MKNFLAFIAIVAIIAGAGYGVKWEIDEWNKKNNPQPVEEKVNNEKVEDNTNVEDNTEIDLSDFE